MKLSIVSTPIGNLEDVTFRAIRTLKEADIILAEDTRSAAKLLAHFEIKGKTVWRYDEHSHERMLPKIIEALEAEKSIALTTDAGTPGISDPGQRLISSAIQQFNNITIEPVPGASALTAAISISGFPMDEFVFLGFPPHKKGRETFFKNLAKEERAVIFYESPHRILKALESMAKFVNPDRQMVVCRELTKMHETIYRGAVLELLEMSPKWLILGEFVVVLGPDALTGKKEYDIVSSR